ncbi:MAG: PQQ-binding-like beta-propeller repeat protein [Pirellulales bacterium]|nr:PQQ-binding-like beta-propeller repeat protein [Pirellulales bacterium]
MAFTKAARVIAIFLVMILSLLRFSRGADTWPQWRGPNRDGFISGPSWPDSLAEDRLKLLWRVDLGAGYAGPIVASDRVFVAETKDQKSEVVRALDRQSGQELWTASWPGAMKVPFMARHNGDWIRSTPAYDGESLYVAGMRDVLVCLNAQSVYVHTDCH